MISKLFKLIGFICLILGFMLLWQRNNPARVAFYSPPVQKAVSSKSVKNSPTRLIIKNLNIDLPIIPAKINGKKWETTTQGVSWLSRTPLPGDKGNSIIYGHNWENLLGKLTRVKTGNKIEITYSNGVRKTFTVATIAIVSPNDASVLRETKDKRVTIYTCTGIFDEKRFVVVGNLI